MAVTYVLCFIGTQLSTGAAIETYRRGHRKWPARPSKPTGAAIENDRRGHRNLPARPSKMTGAAIKTYRRCHRKTYSRWATGVPRAPPPPGQSQSGIKMTVWISSFRIGMFPSKQPGPKTPNLHKTRWPP